MSQLDTSETAAGEQTAASGTGAVEGNHNNFKTNFIIDGPIFGTMGSSTNSTDTAGGTALYESVLSAIEVGYRNFDLAERYSNQQEVGRAIKDSGIPREQFTLINKVDGMIVGDYEEVKSRVVNMLEIVGVDYFDILLIHYPLKSGSDLQDAAPSDLINSASWPYFKEHIGISWKHMTKLKNVDKLTRSIGVSNFYKPHLQELLQLIHQGEEGEGTEKLELASIDINELFIDAAHPEFELVDYCQSKGIQCIAYRPLVFLQVYSFLDGVSDALEQACSSTTTTSAITEQTLILRWLQSRNINHITSSSNKEHMTDNFQATSTSSDVPTREDDVPSRDIFNFISEQSEMVDMYGGVDEYAVAFKNMASL